MRTRTWIGAGVWVAAGLAWAAEPPAPEHAPANASLLRLPVEAPGETGSVDRLLLPPEVPADPARRTGWTSQAERVVDRMMESSSPDNENPASAILRNGLDAFFLEGVETNTYQLDRNADGPRRLSLGTGQIDAWRSARNGAANGNRTKTPTVNLSLEQAEDTREVGVTRIEIGILSNRLWMTHEQAEDEEESISGFQFRKAW